ncbi:hypothetical protein PR202_ga15077 [Eleusine coracana subsp. coracana]|uniref:Pectate lyase n=1 Tax=Eleusine coracana subsp. coracana TaxID=191504 RepID=A0AAV5CJA4_ELECO|nr:hypothetical protein PR202_ga15077 [Eleusine coracana subsp. coracana]
MLRTKKKRKFAGPCLATNPIDRCWRCRPDWATDRKRLARCAQGFGRNTTGGLAGKFYVVTDGTDDDVVNPRPGTLRWAVIQKEPLCRWGFFHVVNNDYTHWLMYAIGGSKAPTIISQGNRYIAPPNLAAKQVTKQHDAPESEWKNWVWHSEDDLFMEGAYFTVTGGDVQRKFNKKDLIKPKPGSYVTRLTRFAGSIPCRPGKPC